MTKGQLEDTVPMLIRRRVLAQLELASVELSDYQNAAIDSICGMVATYDCPRPLETVANVNWPEVVRMLQTLPQTHVITRIFEHREHRLNPKPVIG